VIAEGTIDAWLTDRTTRVLDLCTGNGSLAVLAAMAYPDVQVDAADISRDALEVARINIDKHGLQDRIRLVASDGLSALPGPYDLVLCNPPYVNAASMAQLPAEYRAGVLLLEVPPEPAARLGLQPGDVLLQINGVALRDADEAANALGQLRRGMRVELILARRVGRASTRAQGELDQLLARIPVRPALVRALDAEPAPDGPPQA